tara:strand:+ start:261 stop:929 length:669 start_codon:yes stop_codon:yes gene_type:complete
MKEQPKMSNNRFIENIKECVFEQLEEQFEVKFKEDFIINRRIEWSATGYNDFRDEFILERTNTHEYSYQEYLEYGELMPEYHSIIEYINEKYNDMSGEDIDVKILISTQKTFAHLLCFIGDEWNYEGQIDDDDEFEEILKKYNDLEEILKYKNSQIYFECQDGEKEIVDLSNWILEYGTGNDEMFFDECEEPCFVDREIDRYVCLEYIKNNLVEEDNRERNP